MDNSPRQGAPAEVLVRLYAATLAPDFWARAMALLAPLFRCEKAVVVGLDYNHPRDSVVELLGFSPASVAALHNRNLEEDRIWQASLKLPAGRVYTSSELADYDVIRQGPLWEQVAKPEGLEQFIATILENRPEAFTNIAFLRSYAAGGFDGADRALLEALAPHLRVAVALAKRVSLGDAGRLEALRSFDRARQPLVVLDRSGYALHVNEAARRLLERTDGVTLKPGRFVFDQVATQVEFERLLRQAVAMGDGAEVPPAPRELRVPRRGSGSPLAFTLVPCARASERAVLPPGAGCIVLLYDGDVARRLPRAHLERVYRLTPAELRVCEALFRTGAIEAAADELNLSRHTVRSHLKSIFAKVGVANQGQLLQRLGNTLQMVATGDVVDQAS